MFGDPRAAAERWQDAGAEWIHLVDLDAAFGRGHNAEIIAEVTVAAAAQRRAVRRHPRRRSRWSGRWPPAAPGSTSARRRWSSRSGARRSSPRTGTRSPSVSTSAGSRLAARGWTRDGGDLFETLARLDAAGCARFVVTDVNSDGMLAGPNLELLREVCDGRTQPVIASGGISTLSDIWRCARRTGAARGRRSDHRHGPVRRQLHPDEALALAAARIDHGVSHATHANGRACRHLPPSGEPGPVATGAAARRPAPRPAGRARRS